MDNAAKDVTAQRHEAISGTGRFNGSQGHAPKHKTITLRLLTEEHIPAVKEFNSRLTAAAVPFDLRFPESPISDWLPKIEPRRLYQENFVVLEDDVVRGGYRLKRQDFSLRGKILPLDYFHWPMSEAVINKAYSWVFIVMLRHVQKNHPLLYSLGMAGDEDTLVPRMLRKAGWTVRTLPFFFKVNRPNRFLHEIEYLRKSKFWKWLLNSAVWTGVGELAIKAVQRVRIRGRAEAEAERVRGFASWADDLWNECKDRYAMIAVRDSESLNLLYPVGNERFSSYKISRANKTIGWAVILDTQMRNNKYFGNMRVGTILDCLAEPEDAEVVIQTTTRILEERGVDLIVSNQSQADWCSAFRKAGFFCGPSNFTFGVSPELNHLLSPFDSLVPRAHMTRGDGEGPLNL